MELSFVAIAAIVSTCDSINKPLRHKEIAKAISLIRKHKEMRDIRRS